MWAFNFGISFCPWSASCIVKIRNKNKRCIFLVLVVAFDSWIAILRSGVMWTTKSFSPYVLIVVSGFQYSFSKFIITKVINEPHYLILTSSLESMSCRPLHLHLPLSFLNFGIICSQLISSRGSLIYTRKSKEIRTKQRMFSYCWHVNLWTECMSRIHVKARLVGVFEETCRHGGWMLKL